MEKQEVAAKIIEYVGGKDNIINAWHCMTRLRFDLKNKDLIKQEEIKNLEGVMGIQFAKDQLQIVIGTSVHKYYEILMEMLPLNDGQAPVKREEKQKKDFITWFMDMVSGVFGPIVPAIAGAGMIKGLIGGLVALVSSPIQRILIRLLICWPAVYLRFCHFLLQCLQLRNFRQTNIWRLQLLLLSCILPWLMQLRQKKSAVFYLPE